jgi:predicted nuclease with TOPRIM domain
MHLRVRWRKNALYSAAEKGADRRDYRPELQEYRPIRPALNRGYVALKEKVAELTAEWEGLMGEAERIGADYRKRREELAG